jgi:hypothetical protein
MKNRTVCSHRILNLSDYWDISRFKIFNLSAKYKLIFIAVKVCIVTFVSVGHVKISAVKICIFRKDPDLIGVTVTLYILFNFFEGLLIHGNQ